MLPPTAQPSSADGQEDSEKIFLLVAELTNPEQRESALLELSKRRETFVDLAPILWHSFGTISALLQEIVAIYPLLSPPSGSVAALLRLPLRFTYGFAESRRESRRLPARVIGPGALIAAGSAGGGLLRTL